jgi:hypothetical protein
MVSSFTGFLDHTQRRTTIGRSPLDECSACRRDLYMTTHNTNKRQISMPPVGFEPTISADEWPLGLAVNCIRPNSKTNEHAIILHVHLTVLMNAFVLEAFTRSGQLLSIFIFLTVYIHVYNLSRFVTVCIPRILSEVRLLYAIRRLIVDASSQKTGFNPMRVSID